MSKAALQALVTLEPEPPTSPFSEMPELTSVNVPVALEINPDTTAE